MTMRDGMQHQNFHFNFVAVFRCAFDVRHVKTFYSMLHTFWVNAQYKQRPTRRKPAVMASSKPAALASAVTEGVRSGCWPPEKVRMKMLL